MFMLDGVTLATRPITLARLYCGCTKIYSGHQVDVDAPAICPQPHVCPGILGQPTAEGSLRALTAVQSLLRTYEVR